VGKYRSPGILDTVHRMARKRIDQTPGKGEALLHAVCLRPDDDAPRLLYAEWLEATGDPNDALRAEFIRVQCELARCDLSDDRWGELQERKETLKAYLDRWADALPTLDGVRWNSIDYRRGFIWDVW
jgi:uncharacterized protein (TIGR02996 family)